MALIPIMGQPVNLVPNNETPYGCATENRFCSLYSKDSGEYIRVQMIQTPCDASLVSNGTFITDADWNYDANIVIAGQKATHVIGSVGQINQDIYGALSAGNYVVVSVTVTDMSGGTIDVHIGEIAATKTITENGIYTFYVFPVLDDTTLLFEFSADCDGSISNISSYKLLDESEVTAYLIDSTGAVAYTMTTVIALTSGNMEDRIIFSIPTFTLAEGCYTVQVIDPCIDFDELTEVFVDPTFDDAGEWTVGTDIGIAPDISSGRFNVPADYWGKKSFAVQPFNIPTGVDLLVVAKLVTGTRFITDTVKFKTDLVDIIQFGTSGIAIPQNTTFIKYKVISSNYLDVSSLDMGIETQAGWDIYFPTPTANAAYVTGDNDEFLEVSLMVAPASEVSGVFNSNCIKIASDVADTRLVIGRADEVATYPLPNKSLGFLFHRDTFWLQARLAVSFSNPHTPTITENNLYSSGRRKKTFAQLTKAWDLTFVEADENMHDTIANIINCDEFTIDGNEYITEEKEYTANYGSKGVAAVAESTIEVIKIEGTRFNTNV